MRLMQPGLLIYSCGSKFNEAGFESQTECCAANYWLPVYALLIGLSIIPMQHPCGPAAPVLLPEGLQHVMVAPTLQRCRPAGLQTYLQGIECQDNW